jgi:prepilin-type N-terminal cleavage/methylation domain-containing protein
MLSALRHLQQEEAGFTMVELLVVTLVMGILASIALPSFFNQRGKAYDTRAMATARSAMVAIETCAAEWLGGYATCDASALHSIEPTLPDKPTLKVSGLGEGKYKIVVRSEPPSRRFTVQRNNKGVVKFACNSKGEGGCPADGKWE